LSAILGATIKVRLSIDLSKASFRKPSGLPKYLRVCGLETPYTSVFWCGTTWRGTNRGYKGVEIGETSYISYVYASPNAILPIEW